MSAIVCTSISRLVAGYSRGPKIVLAMNEYPVLPSVNQSAILTKSEISMSLEQTLERIAGALETIAKSAANPALTAVTTATAPVGRKPRAVATATVTPAVEVGESESSAAADAAPAAPKAVTADDLKASVIALIKGGLRPQALAIVTKYGGTDASSIRAKDRQAAFDEMAALIADLALAG